jgi:nicotinamidase-related amidase
MPDNYPPLDPGRTALLVMDFQPGILGMLTHAEALLAQVERAIAIVRERGGQIAYVRVAFEDADFAAIPPTSKMAVRAAQAGGAFHADSPATAVHERLAPREGDIVVRKTRVGAFSTTNLDEQLRERGIINLILAGISTSGVVLSTVRDAADRDYQVFVLEDASADPEPAVHAFLTEKIFPRQAHVVRISELESLLSLHAD